MFLIFDTETTGLPAKYGAPHTDLEAWGTARLVQLAWQLHDETGKLLDRKNYIVKPVGFEIPYAVVKIHGISNERALEEGLELSFVLAEFEKDLARANYNVGHNIEFDIKVVGSEYFRAGIDTTLFNLEDIDTKLVSTDYCALPGGRGGKFKWPTLTELHTKLFGKAFEDAHDAAYDVDATARCFFALITNRVYIPDEVRDPQTVVYEAPKLAAANFKQTKKATQKTSAAKGKVLSAEDKKALEDAPFVHLHCHSQYSVLQATSTTDSLIATAKSMNMPAIAMTDHGNMMGAYNFVKSGLDSEITPIVGCEFNLCKSLEDKSYKDDGYQTVILAKNKKGYHNLAKLSSAAFTDGFYYVPRIDREILLRYKEDLIVLSGGIWGEVPSKILNIGEAVAEEALLWWKEHFADDFYVEINRHGIEEEDVINKALLKFCEKHDVKYIASNNTYYSEKSDASAHDILLCVRDAESVNKPKKYIGKRGREYRYGFPNEEYYIKTPTEMKRLFADLPEAIFNIKEIIDKVESYKLARNVLLPAYDIPEEFVSPEDLEDGGKRGENAFLRHLTYVGAEKRYGEITEEIRERLDFELETIQKTGYPGYFLIVQDFTTASREMGVSVGPGRGSAAGSAVAYCVGITNVDPIKYDLLFERFLNPDRVSLPDIDIDFDDEGREKVIQYVIDKYGANQVAQIITYGSMAAKSSIRDTGRVLELPLSDTDRIAKLIPDMKLKKLFGFTEEELKKKLKSSPEDLEKANQLIALSKGNDLEARTINQARMIEGSLRNTGIHACGVIITPDDITNHVPVALAKDSGMYCTQFDNAVVEDAGLLKMDFLGLKTLTLIKESVRLVKEKHNVDLVPDDFPLDDEKTYELFQRGETVGIFQYESAGMQKYMKELKPTTFADLIAMNALYRPGPIEYIPSFIKRKHGTEPIEYDLDGMEEYLKETYGITVYQEQVMLLSQKLADFTKGEADVLRKAMGKKQHETLAKMKPKFIEQAVAKGHDAKILEKVWKDWEAFASYAFNKSHSTCYAWIAFQTAYLKAHYPAEYMAAVLSNNMNDIKQVSFFMEECKRMGAPVLGPCVNESSMRFSVNDKGEIRFGLAAIKGVGGAAVDSIIEERNKDGLYRSIYDMARRVDLRAANKRVWESLAYGGGFDSFQGNYRAQYFAPNNKGVPFFETLVKYGNAWKNGQNSNQHSLFGDDDAADIPEPPMASAEPWGTLEKLSKEKEVVGIYISGHPLDDFRLEIDNFCTKGGLALLQNVNDHNNRSMRFAGIVSEANHRMTKNGKPFGVLTLEDYQDSNSFFIFGDEYVKFREYLVEGWFLFLTGRVQQRKWSKDPNELEYKINSIELLTDIKERMAKHLNMTVRLNDINDEFTERISKLFEKYPGKCRVKFQVKSLETKITMPSKNVKVDLSKELMSELEGMNEVEFFVEG